MSIYELSVRQPVTISMVYVLVCVVAAIFVPRLGVALYPATTNPVLSVTTTYDNVGPEEIEKTVTRILESRLSVVSGLKSMSSTSSFGRSNIRLTFGYDIDLDEASNTIKDILTRAVYALPDGADAPTLRKFDVNMMPIMRLSVSGDLPISELRVLAEDTIAPLLERIEGVASASVSGGASRIVRVDIMENRLKAYNLTLSTVASALAARNIQASGGTVTENGMNYEIYFNESFNSIDDIRQSVVAGVSIPSSSSSVTRSNVIRLEDIANVYEMYDYTGQKVYIDGVPGLYISISNETDSNSTTVAKAVREAFGEINSILPYGVSIATISDNTTMITATMNEVYNSAFQGGILAILIILLFLRSIKSTFVIALSMPISILVTLLCMSLLDLTLNMMTMSGLILGIGMIVDSSIVVLDDIHRFREAGENPAVASIHGTKEVAVAITASTLTTLCVFVPILIYKAELETLGQMFNDMVITVAISLTVSLIVSVTLVPALCGSILRLDTRVQKPLKNRFFRALDSGIETGIKALENAYGKMLAFVLRNRLLVMTLVVLLLVVSIMKFMDLGMSFSPATTSDDTITVSLTLPQGTNKSVTEEVLFQVQEIVEQKVTGYQTLILTVGNGNTGNIQINLPPVSEQKMTPLMIRELIKPDLDNIPNATFTYTAGRGFRSGAPIDVKLISNDTAAVSQTAEKIVDILEMYVPEVTDVATDLETGSPQYIVRVDRDRAAALGVSMSAISSVLRASINGVEATTWQSGNDEVTVSVYLPEDEVSSPSDLSRLYVNGSAGRVPLDSLLSFEPAVSPRAITREEGQRVNHVTANLQTGLAANKIQPLVEAAIRDNLVVPETVRIEYAGEVQDLADSGGVMILVILVAVFLVFIVMAAQFESLVDPLIIFFSIPLLAIGVVWMYVFTGQTFSLFSAVGVVALVGIVVNNGIVLIDFMNQLVKKKTPVFEACIIAGKNRLRPILMTTLTTIIATIPMGFFPGDGAEMTQPIGVTMVGGLLSGAIMTLFVTPIMYSLLNKRREKRFDDPNSLQNMLAEYKG
ncbi:efflux RND transporter permease subunit [Brucepastera parasyntrophica]|uniref:efflux RND transporter permease subunit n=1 Tax=Brucepastera parasyntrophica TaxID=2880008 RepID=UPI00210D608C|nr:efflux RND transporter permease subunit [Brucepastera parasyntrophica]ULQ58738.1 efflux RND transporter permease subunit [Brucepastera parasyntrophica]